MKYTIPKLLLILIISTFFIDAASANRIAIGHRGKNPGAKPTNPATLPRPLLTRDYPNPSPELVHLGQRLFFDRNGSGNRNIACSDCHDPRLGTTDNLSLPIGEGGEHLGPERNPGDARERVPRNAPQIFNIALFTTMFWDRRIEPTDGPKKFVAPSGDDFPEGFEFAGQAQAIHPFTSAAEMAGQMGENEIANAFADGNIPLGWALVVGRFMEDSSYLPDFKKAFPGEIFGEEDVTIVHIGKALFAYEDFAFRTINAPFNKYLQRDFGALSPNAIKGMNLFYGRGKCSTCHAGSLLTDEKTYNIGALNIVGKGDGEDLYGDDGRQRETGNPADFSAFRTPSLWNVADTAPYFHAGTALTLEEAVRWHVDMDSLKNYVDAVKRGDQVAILPMGGDVGHDDFLEVFRNPETIERIDAGNVLRGAKYKSLRDLSPQDIEYIVTFLREGLTDPTVSGSQVNFEVPQRD